ncbi:MAG: SgcJ/EcaC family oxidoreductase, partial [Sphingomonas sp.]
MLIVPVMLAVATPATAEAAITAAMTDSAAGWSAGDMPRFLAVYAEDAVFVTRNGLVRGKPAIAARYAAHYGADPAARGRLSFRTLGFRRIDAAHHMLWANWRLDYPGGKQDSGVTSLLFERRAAGWKIVSDHSS